MLGSVQSLRLARKVVRTRDTLHISAQKLFWQHLIDTAASHYGIIGYSKRRAARPVRLLALL